MDGEDDGRAREHRGWHTPRGLPHFDSADTTQAVTFRLADALPDYFDRFMRDEAHLERTRAYIEANPVTAGLVAAPGDWPFSSAGWR